MAALDYYRNASFAESGEDCEIISWSFLPIVTVSYSLLLLNAAASWILLVFLGRDSTLNNGSDTLDSSDIFGDEDDDDSAILLELPFET